MISAVEAVHKKAEPSQNNNEGNCEIEPMPASRKDYLQAVFNLPAKSQRLIRP